MGREGKEVTQRRETKSREYVVVVVSESMLLYKYTCVRCARTTEETKPKQDRNLLTDPESGKNSYLLFDYTFSKSR